MLPMASGWFPSARPGSGRRCTDASDGVEDPRKCCCVIVTFELDLHRELSRPLAEGMAERIVNLRTVRSRGTEGVPIWP